MAKAGRPRKEIDAEQFEKLCALQCTESEICGWFGITDKTLASWCRREYGADFSEVYEKKREVGKISLRRAQFHLAEKNAAMAIFLGKNYLGQRDTLPDMGAEANGLVPQIIEAVKRLAE